MKYFRKITVVGAGLVKINQRLNATEEGRVLNCYRSPEDFVHSCQSLVIHGPEDIADLYIICRTI